MFFNVSYAKIQNSYLLGSFSNVILLVQNHSAESFKIPCVLNKDKPWHFSERNTSNCFAK